MASLLYYIQLNNMHIVHIYKFGFISYNHKCKTMSFFIIIQIKSYLPPRPVYKCITRMRGNFTYYSKCLCSHLSHKFESNIQFQNFSFICYFFKMKSKCSCLVYYLLCFCPRHCVLSDKKFTD